MLLADNKKKSSIVASFLPFPHSCLTHQFPLFVSPAPQRRLSSSRNAAPVVGPFVVVAVQFPIPTSPGILPSVSAPRISYPSSPSFLPPSSLSRIVPLHLVLRLSFSESIGGVVKQRIPRSRPSRFQRRRRCPNFIPRDQHLATLPQQQHR